MTASTPQRWRALVSSAILIAISMIFVAGGLRLGLGTPFRLGTGAFPFLTGLVLIGLSLAIAAHDWRGTTPSKSADWLNFGAISAALAVFAMTADRIGLMPAVFLTILVASAPDRSLPIQGKIILGLCVALGAWGIFIAALNLPLKAFDWGW